MHTEPELSALGELFKRLDGEIRVVMEATGIYHLPILTFLQEKGFFISVINPYAMKKYVKDNGVRGAKTDKLDSISIANYGIEKWYKLQEYKGEEVYAELKLLGRRYRHYMELHIAALQALTHIWDYTMPGTKKLLKGWNEANNKLSDFVEMFWHSDVIVAMNRDEFVSAYVQWAKERKYPHTLASECIPVLWRISGGSPVRQHETSCHKTLAQARGFCLEPAV